MATAFTTAIDAWDKRWMTPEGRADWLDPEPDVMALLPELKARGVRTALDLGCGVGRHALLLAEHGLAVEATGGSAAASRSCARWREPAACRWVCIRERPMRCRSTTAASISCYRGT
jgi:SAM-dependent methyltransferase